MFNPISYRNANQNHSETLLLNPQDGYKKKKKMTSADKGGEKLESLFIFVESVKWCSHFENCLMFAQEVCHRITAMIYHLHSQVYTQKH